MGGCQVYFFGGAEGKDAGEYSKPMALFLVFQFFSCVSDMSHG
jgi:hypothetical protein